MQTGKKHKVLIFALSGIGDALMFTPALRLLRNNFPYAEIDVIVMYKGSEEILRSTGLADKVVRFDFLKEGPFRSLSFVLSLGRNRYSHAINVYPSNRKEYNIISFLTGAVRRGAVKYIRRDLTNLGFLNNVTVREDDTRHNVETNLLLVRKMFGIESGDKPPLIFNISDDSNAWAVDYLKKINSGKKYIIGMHPGCSTLKNHIKRRWEPEKFADLAENLSVHHNASVLIFGGPEEDELKNYVKSKTTAPDIRVVNAPSLAKSAALINLCHAFVTNDSSLMHVSAAMGVRTVAIIGPTNTSYIYPWQTEHRIAALNLECAPCFFYSPKPLSCTRTDVQYKCIKELMPEHVFSKLTELLPDLAD